MKSNLTQFILQPNNIIKIVFLLNEPNSPKSKGNTHTYTHNTYYNIHLVTILPYRDTTHFTMHQKFTVYVDLLAYRYLSICLLVVLWLQGNCCFVFEERKSLLILQIMLCNLHILGLETVSFLSSFLLLKFRLM